MRHITSPSSALPSHLQHLVQYPLLAALQNRRSRRFGAGMTMPSGPLQFQSRFQPVPLTEEEEAVLCFAACGLTGPALADLCYSAGHGGNIMAGLAGRTIASGDGIQTVALFVMNDRATYLLRRPQDLDEIESAELISLGRQHRWLELYRRTRVPLQAQRAVLPSEPIFNLEVNRWSANAPGTTYFLPVQDLTFLYINGLLEIFSPSTGVFVVDERAHFGPAGLKRFARSRGGHLEDDPNKGRLATIRQVETMVTEFTTIESGMMLQNLALMAQAMGLGGFPSFANHEFGWFEALGFRMGRMPAAEYLGANAITRLGMKLLGKNPMIPYAQGLEHAGKILLKSCAPPYRGSMREAVQAVAKAKIGQQTLPAPRTGQTAWKTGPEVVSQIPKVSEEAVEAAVAYCEYVQGRYGRFPALLPPFRTVVGFQAAHLDVEFYDRFYKPEALSETHRQDFAHWTAQRTGDRAEGGLTL